MRNPCAARILDGGAPERRLAVPVSPLARAQRGFARLGDEL
jgi:hypothetical protein